MKFRKTVSLVFIILGCVAIVASASILAYNKYDASRAKKAVKQVLSRLEEAIAQNAAASSSEEPPEVSGVVTSGEVSEEISSPDGVLSSGELSVLPESSVPADPPPHKPPEQTSPRPSVQPSGQTSQRPSVQPPEKFVPEDFGLMPEVEINGRAYIGTLQLPTLEKTLPICSHLAYSGLRVAPCRQFGTVKDNDLVIAGHNYPAHFYGLHKLKNGDPVIFTDVKGVVTDYAVVSVDVISSYAENTVRNSEWDLVLYTCNYSMRERIMVGCLKLPPGSVPQTDSHPS